MGTVPKSTHPPDPPIPPVPPYPPDPPEPPAPPEPMPPDPPVARTTAAAGVTVVIPSIGRPSLAAALAALATQLPHPGLAVQVLVVDDRRERVEPLDLPPGPASAFATVLAGSGRGPAAARNIGWRAARHPWVVFLDDDVVPGPDWLAALCDDLTVAGQVGGVQGRIRVPLPDRPATDWERVTAGLTDGAWITADMAYRRDALAAVGGFDERFPRAYREDAELAYRVRIAGWRLRRGRRTVTHPVRPERPWVSLAAQRGNADDALLRRMYGTRWRPLLDIAPGRRHRHAVVTAAGAVAVGASAAAVLTGRRGGGSRWSRGWRVTGGLAAAAWLAGTTEFTMARIRPGPATPREVATMVVTSAVIPVLASTHWLRGWWAARGQHPLAIVPAPRAARTAPPQPGSPATSSATPSGSPGTSSAVPAGAARPASDAPELMFTSPDAGHSLGRATSADRPSRG